MARASTPLLLGATLAIGVAMGLAFGQRGPTLSAQATVASANPRPGRP